MAIRGDPNSVAAKWASRTASASSEYQAGIQRVTTAPGQAAAAKFEKYRQGVIDNAEKWRRNVASVQLEEWRQRAVSIGASRFAAGAQASQDKFSRFAAEFFPHLEAGLNRVRAMPDTTLEQRLERARAMALHNAQFRRRGGGGFTPPAA